MSRTTRRRSALVVALLIVAAVLDAQTAVAQTPSQVSQGVATLRGTVIDAKTSSPIADARVVLAELGRPVQTAADGRFEFKDVAARAYTLNVSIIGYSFHKQTITLAPNVTTEVTIPLTEGTGQYQETVTVKADTTPPGEIGVSSQAVLGSGALQDLRGIAADDSMRAMQALPGVAQGDDFQAQFTMRGFSFREIGVVTDNTATPLLIHTVRGQKDTGSIAMINSDVLSQASLLAGPHPLRDGDWLGPTLSFDMREGSRDRTGVRVAVSGTSASAVLEGALGGSRRGSWLVSLRKSYIDWLIKKVMPDVSDTIGFSDMQGKIAYDLTGHQQVQVTFVGGQGVLEIPDAKSANAVRRATSLGGMVSVGWRYSGKGWLVSQRASFASNRFTNKGAQEQDQGHGVTPSLMYRADVSLMLNPLWAVEGGGRTEGQQARVSLTNYTTKAGAPKVQATLNASIQTRTSDAWGQIARRSARTGFVLGARAAHDTFTGRTATAPWLLAEVRAGAFTFQGGAGRTHQFPSLDLQVGASPALDPSQATSVDLGVTHTIGHGLLWQVTGWTRQNRNVLRPIGEDRIVGGKRVSAGLFPLVTSTLDGRSRGMDVVVARKSSTGLTGWIGYTYAHTRFHDHATGEDFDGDYDQRHTINVFVQAKLSYRWAVNARWRYGSNFPISGYFSGTPFDLHLSNLRNQVRLPVYSRLDLRANRTFTFNTKRLTLFIEVMNVLNRHNMGQSTGTVNATTFAVTNVVTRLIPRIPSAGFLIEF